MKVLDGMLGNVVAVGRSRKYEDDSEPFQSVPKQVFSGSLLIQMSKIGLSLCWNS